MLKITFLFVALQVGGSLARAVEDPENAAALRAVANDGLEFSKKFYEVIAKTEPGNLICSPVSVSSLLSMVTYGARGDTETALKTGLFFNKDDNVQKKGLKTLVEELNDSPGVELRLANKIFLAEGVNIQPAYQQLTEEIFKSTVQKVDFSKPAAAVKTINDWCEEQTNSKIKNVLSPESVNAATAAVMVNAAYFKGKWVESFDKDRTHDDVFHLEDGTTKNLPTMHAQSHYNFGVLRDVKARFAELPYEGGQVSMFIVLPDEVTGLKNLQENFAQLNINRLFNNGLSTELIFSLPKFEIETQINLNNPLTDLGMGKIFEGSADFGGMFDRSVAVDQAIQKAYIKVDEEGTEAAAVTALIVGITSVSFKPIPLEFRADRPFYYAIVKKVEGPQKSGIVLFEGHYKGN